MANPKQVFDLADRTAWDGATHGRRRKFRRMISLAYLVSFRLGRWFPNAIPLVYVVGYPKSGTSWVAQLVADYLRLPFPQHSILPIGCPAVFQGHQRVDRKLPNGVYVVRDGRDVLISGYHHLRGQFLAGGGSRLHRTFFRSIDVEAPVRENLCKFIEHSAKHPFACRQNWGQHVQAYFESSNPNVQLVKYEDLLSDPFDTLSCLFEGLSGQPIDAPRLEDSIERFSFEGQKVSKGENAYLRTGRMGDWLNHFDAASAELFHHYYGKALTQAGYESGASWLSKVKQNSGTT